MTPADVFFKFIAMSLVLSLLIVINYFRRDESGFYSSLFILVLFSFNALGYVVFILPLDPVQQVNHHYLFHAIAHLALALALIFINKTHMTRLTSLSILLLIVSGFLLIALHIDRNMFALNGAPVPNLQSKHSWLLWDILDWVGHAIDISIISSLAIPKIYQPKSTRTEDVLALAVEVHDFVSALPQSNHKKLANAYLQACIEGCGNIVDLNAEQVPFITKANLTSLKLAIKLSKYDPGPPPNASIWERILYEMQVSI